MTTSPTQISTARSPGTTSLTFRAPDPAPAPPKPTFDQVCDRMRAAGVSRKDVGRLMRMFKEAAEAVDYAAGTSEYIVVDMAVHDALDDIMRDKAASTPGSIHEDLERLFLQPGWGLEHDKHGHCSIQAIPK